MRLEVPSRRAAPRFALTLLAAVVLVACGGDDAKPVATVAGPTLLAAGTTAASPAGSASAATPSAAPGSVTATARAASPSAAASPTAADGCPVPDAGVCTFAASVQRALQTGAVEQIAAAFKTVEVTCVTPGQGIDPAAGLCQARAPGDKVSGYPIGRRASEGSIVSRAGLLQFLSKFAIAGPVNQHDDYGDWLVRLYTIASPSRNGCTAACVLLEYSYISRQSPSDRFARGLMEFSVERSGADFAISLVLDGIIIPSELPTVLSGGTYQGRTYAPWSPGLGTTPATNRPLGKGGPFLLGQEAKAAPAANAECSERKSAPGKTAGTVDCLKAGASLSIDGGPVDAEGARWWRVHPNASGPSASAWIPADQLTP